MKEATATPNFLIIGAPKCGTTSLFAWLAEHPYIYMSPHKEPCYFSSDLGNRRIHSWKAYTRLFSAVRRVHLAAGEASTAYLFSQVAVPSIEEQLPDTRYIVMIRNPVEMAYSLHDQQIRSHNENVEDFQEAWHLSPERRAGRQAPRRCKDPLLLDYQAWCKLGEQLERLYKRVPPERVLVLVLDDVRADPRREYLRALEFLRVPDDGREDFPVHNPAREWRSRRLAKAIRGFARGVTWAKYIAKILPKRSLGIVRQFRQLNTRERPRPPMAVEMRAELESFYEEDIRRLENLLGREFPAWRQIRIEGR